MNNNNQCKITPWITPTQTMSNNCYKLTMDMKEKQPPTPLPIYEKINIYKEPIKFNQVKKN